MAAGVMKDQFIRSRICQEILEDPRLFNPDKCKVSRTDSMRYALFSMPHEEIESRFNALLNLQKQFDVSVIEAPCLNANLRNLSKDLFFQNIQNNQPDVTITSVDHYMDQEINTTLRQLKDGEIDYISITTDPDNPLISGQNYLHSSGGIFLHKGDYYIHSTNGNLFYEKDDEPMCRYEYRQKTPADENKKIANGALPTRLDGQGGGEFAIYLQRGHHLHRMLTINVDPPLQKEPVDS